MALQLELNTQSAQQQLKAVAQDLAALKTALNGFRVTKGFNNVLTSLSGFRGVPYSAVQSINSLTNSLSSLERIAGASNRVAALSKSLRQLNGLKLDNLAGQVQKVNTALAGLRIPPSVARIAGQLEQIGRAARTASGGVGQLGNAMRGIRAVNLSGAVTQFNSFRTATSGATQNVSAFGSAMRTAGGIVAAFGIGSATQALANFARGSYDAINSTQRFLALMKQFTGTGEGAAKELDYVRGVADKLALPIGKLQESYPKLMLAMSTSGQTADESRQIFEKFSTVFRSLHLSQDQVARGFLAIEQMYSKGTVSMEELRRQLGELFPAFNLLAKGMGVTTAELSKMISKGEVSADQLGKLADEAMKTYGGALPDSLKSAEAAMTAFHNAMYRLQENFGRGFYSVMTPALQQFAKTLENVNVQKSLESIGQLAGQLASGLLKAIELVIKNWSWLQYVLGAFVATKAIGVLGSLIKRFADSATAALTFGRMVMRVAQIMGPWGAAVATVVRVFGPLIYSVGGAITAIGKFIFAMSPLGRAIAAITVVVGAAYTAYQYFAGSAEKVATNSNNAANGVRNSADAIKAAGGAAKENTTALNEFANSAQKAAAIKAQGLYDVAKAMTSMGYSAGQTAEYWNAFKETAAGISPSLGTAVEALANAEKALASTGATAENTAEYTVALRVVLDQVNKAADGTAVNLNHAGNALNNAAKASEEAAGGLKKTVNAAQESAKAASSAKSAWTSWADSTVSAIRSVINWLGDLIKRAYEAAKSILGISSGGSGGGGSSKKTNSSSYAGGGIAGQPSARTTSVPSSAFVGAPSFAGGGISDGGIPAILHPNEAVVPLTGGGAIPIDAPTTPPASNNGNSANKLMNELLVVTRQNKNNTGRILDRVTTNTLVIRSGFEKNHMLLERINATAGMIVKGLERISTSSGGGSSGGSGTGYMSGSYSSAAEQLLSMLDAQGAGSGGRKTMYGVGGGTLQMIDNKIVASGSGAHWEAAQPYIQQSFDSLKQRIQTGAYTEAEILQMIQNLQQGYGASKNVGKSGALRFATGSPNASKDAKGGFAATLHPDEAVIPLPDGRSVPVSFAGGVEDTVERTAAQVKELLKSVNRRDKVRVTASGGGTTNVFNITMNFPNADATSFRESQPQIRQQLTAELEKASRTIGRRPAADDPTRRLDT